MLTSPYPSSHACCSSVKMRVVPDPRGPVMATTPAAPKLSCPKSDSRDRTASSSSVTTRTTMPCSTSWGGEDKLSVTLCLFFVFFAFLFVFRRVRIVVDCRGLQTRYNEEDARAIVNGAHTNANIVWSCNRCSSSCQTKHRTTRVLHSCVEMRTLL